MANPDIQKKIEQTQSEGRDLHITGTPTTFINGRRLMGPDEQQFNQYFKFEASVIQ
jgi:protein-disulfide isomerase